MAGHVSAPLFVAHVRASTGAAVQHTNSHPFRHRQWLWVHNGAIREFGALKRRRNGWNTSARMRGARRAAATMGSTAQMYMTGAPAHLTQPGAQQMTTFSVWKFDDPDGAERALRMLRDAATEQLVKIDDAAIVSWPMGASQPSTKHGHEETWRGAGWGSVLGLLIGTLFFLPIVGGLAGAALGALAKSTEDAGITKEQLEKIRIEITEGTSALFVVTEQGDLDRLGDRMRGMHSSALLATNLTDAERGLLLETFGGA
jgi:uncharacterized membrane protein